MVRIRSGEQGGVMCRFAIGVWALALAAGCGAPDRMPAAARAELTPGGTLRAGINFGNPVLAAKDAVSGEARGVAVDLVRELGRRLDAAVQLVTYDSAAAMADAAGSGAWDVAFLAADAAREDAITFTAPYLELEATYLVPVGSRLRSVEEVDAAGVRVAARPRSAYDLFLRRSLMRAELVYPEGDGTDLDLLLAGRADVLAGLRHGLMDTALQLPGSQVLDGRFAMMQQAIGVPNGRPAAAAYVRDFVEDVKATGFVALAIEASGARGASVAPAAGP